MDNALGENSLGWNIDSRPQKEGRLKEERKHFSLFESRQGEKKYCLNVFPELSREEEELLAKLSGLFQKKEEKATSKDLEEFLKKYCLQNLVLLEKKQFEYLLLALEKQLFGFGPIDFLLKDEELEEIAVIGTGKEKPVHVFHIEHGWLATNIFFSKEETVRDIVNRMSRDIGRRLSMKEPVLNAVLPDGNRLSAAINPVSFSGPCLSIRKFRKKPFTPADLIKNNTFSMEAMAFLWIAMQCDCSILVVGNTGSGKTSSLNALLSFVPKSERIVLVEETPEIRVQHRHFVKLNVVKEQGVGMQDLIVESLRMRPDRILVGEIRNKEEVTAFVDTLLAGQGKGSYATFHGQNTRETLNRMRCLGILETDLAALDLVIVQRRWNSAGKKADNKEIRHVTEVVELAENRGKVEMNEVFGFDYEKSTLVQKNKSAKVFEKARRSFSFEEKGFQKELEKRKNFLKKISKEKTTSGLFFRKVNDF